MSKLTVLKLEKAGRAWERIQVIDEGQSPPLFGVLTEPECSVAAAPAAIIVNAGMAHNIVGDSI